MCGVDKSTADRVGARADLFTESQGHFGSLLFVEPDVPGSTTATHVRFTSAGHGSAMLNSQFIISIQ